MSKYTAQDLRAAPGKDEKMEDLGLVLVPTEMKNASNVSSRVKAFLLAELGELHALRERLVAEKDGEIRAVEMI
ncbi:hypothetical protein SBOR_0263 [Sclerotinia borealis F-4128]|uniref:Uncharacterized protein n=1 Tax=Sclerotinia borealis (strain F-4128) TaxID=1432307 RepID=W9CTA2_SCLBF|nr:hypothetical protein SBOR_0263 [Sclerotinia borealis F-4128]